MGVCFSRFLGTGSPRWACQQTQILLRILPSLQTATLSLCSHRAKEVSVESPLRRKSIRSWCPTLVSSSTPRYLPEAHLLVSSHWEEAVQHINLKVQYFPQRKGNYFSSQSQRCHSAIVQRTWPRKPVPVTASRRQWERNAGPLLIFSFFSQILRNIPTLANPLWKQPRTHSEIHPTDFLGGFECR